MRKILEYLRIDRAEYQQLEEQIMDTSGKDDIACPLCREKYGNTNGKYQELEGPALTEEFLQDTGLPKEMIRRVCFLVGHHHTVDQVDGIDYQILLEADYLVNAEESGYSAANIRNTKEKLFRTQTGTALLESICQLKM